MQKVERSLRVGESVQGDVPGLAVLMSLLQAAGQVPSVALDTGERAALLGRAAYRAGGSNSGSVGGAGAALLLPCVRVCRGLG